MTTTSHKGKTIAGLAALAATAAGVYFFYGSKNAGKNRRTVKSWMFRMKGEVLDRLENLKDVSEEMYYDTIDEVKTKYAKLSTISKADLDDMTDELKSHWKDIKKEIAAKRTVKEAKKMMKKE